MEKALEDLVELVRQYPEGVVLGKLKALYQRTYNRNLCPLDLGFNSMRNLVDNLPELTLTAGPAGKRTVFHRSYNPHASMEAEGKDKIIENIINMVMKHSNGYALQTLPTTYRQKYQTELSLGTLGFNTMEALIESLNEHLVIIGKRVFHVMHKTKQNSADNSDPVEVTASSSQPQNGLPTPALSSLGTPLSAPAFSTARPSMDAPGSARLPQDQPFQKVQQEVMKNYSLDSLPKTRLPSCYDERNASHSKFTATNGLQEPTDFLTKERDLKDLVDMVRLCPKGINLEILMPHFEMTYGRSLSPKALGFSSIVDLIVKLNEHFLINGAYVFPKSAIDVNAASPREKEKILENLLNMLKSRPNGVRLKTLTTVYVQTYNTKMSLETLGFTSVESMVKAFPDQMFIHGKKLFHVKYKEQKKKSNSSKDSDGEDEATSSQPKESFSSAALSFLGPPLMTPSFSTPTLPVETPSTAPKPSEPKDAWQRLKIPKPTIGSLLPDADLPALGAAAPEEPIPTAKAEVPKAKGRNMFMDGYHSRLREVHGANMRAMETLDTDTGSRGRSLDPQRVNDLMKDVIRQIATEGELVTRDKVISRSCQLLQIPSLESAWIHPRQIQALKDLQYVIREVNMFLQATESVSSICTLYELGQSLAALKDKKRYEELSLGPLCKLPLVHRLFKIHSDTKDDDIPQIETVDILRQLRNFRRRSPGAKIDLADFLKHLADHYNCDSPYELGIRIHSVGLPIATLSKVTRGEHNLLEKAREKIQKELEEEAMERMRKAKKSVLETLPPTASFSSAANMELRSRYASLTAAEVVLAVFSNSEGVFSQKMTKHVQAFLLQVSGDRLATALFQLSICGGSLAAPQDLVLKDKTSKSKEQAKAEEKPSAPLPSEAAVKQFVRESLSSQTSLITLSHMAALEKKLIKHFHLNNFLCLELGSFLDFLTKHTQLLEDCLGSSLVLSSSSLDRGGSALRPTRQYVFEFIKQCGDVDYNDPEEVHSLLRKSSQ